MFPITLDSKKLKIVRKSFDKMKKNLQKFESVNIWCLKIAWWTNIWNERITQTLTPANLNPTRETLYVLPSSCVKKMLVVRLSTSLQSLFERHGFID